MATHAATATTIVTTLAALSIITALVTLCYLAACWHTPFTRCGRCHGTGNRPTLTGRTRPCRHCDTTGHRLRPGRRLINHLRRLHDQDTP